MFQQILSLFAGDSWQDLVLSVGNIFFCFTLIPALRHPGRPPLMTFAGEPTRGRSFGRIAALCL
jgi:hypothetical protein